MADSLVKFHNVFIAKARYDIVELYPDPLYPPPNKNPIVGYYVIPTETVEILRDKHNRPRWYRQRIDDISAFNSGQSTNSPQWNAKDVIHLYRDKKPGRAWGTPFLTAAIDDVIALRQIEEDVQNLVHRELFPLYKYKIGTEEYPAEPEEIERAASELEGLRTEGGLILPERHEVEVIGAENNALDATPYLTHMKERVATGLGLYPHHLGMLSVNSGGNRAMTDRLDIALYDRIKEYQRYLAEAVRLYVFNELLIEGGFDPMVNPQSSNMSDRCMMHFKEIDIDTQIKKDAATSSLVTSGVITIPEGRIRLGVDPNMDESESLQAMQVRLQPDTIVPGEKTATGTQKPPKTVDTTPSAARQNTQRSSTGGNRNLPNLKRGNGNIVRPANQFGSRTSPGVRHSSDDEKWLSEVVELLDVNLVEEI
jgi:hypothetical protein